MYREKHFRSKNPSISNFRQWLKRNFGDMEYHISLDAGYGVMDDYVDYTIADTEVVIHYEYFDDVYYAFIKVKEG